MLVVRDLRRLATLAYDFESLQRLCREHDWVTVQLVAAAFAGYLRSRGCAATGDRFVVEQGVEMGRPSRIEVELLERAALISGHAVRIGVDSC